MKKGPRKITSGEKITVFIATLVCAFFVSGSVYGYVLAPLIVILFNGILLLYDRQVRNHA